MEQNLWQNKAMKLHLWLEKDNKREVSQDSRRQKKKSLHWQILPLRNGKSVKWGNPDKAQPCADLPIIMSPPSHNWRTGGEDEWWRENLNTDHVQLLDCQKGDFKRKLKKMGENIYNYCMGWRDLETKATIQVHRGNHQHSSSAEDSKRLKDMEKKEGT